MALPRELNPDQRRALVEDFIAQEIGGKHAYQWAIHTPNAALEKGEQPHAHIMYSERMVDGIDRDPAQYFKRYNAKAPENGGCRKDSAGTEERLQATRQRWADVQNLHLERHGHAARVDHRSLEAQGIDRQPEKHIGASRVKDMQAQDIAALLTRRAAEGELEQAQKQVGLIDLSGDLAAAKAERDRQPAPEVKQAAASGVADFRAQFEAAKLAEAGKQQARQAFEQFKAEQQAQQRQAELAKQQAEQERQQPKRGRDNDDGPGWSR